MHLSPFPTGSDQVFLQLFSKGLNRQRLISAIDDLLPVLLLLMKFNQAL